VNRRRRRRLTRVDATTSKTIRGSLDDGLSAADNDQLRRRGHDDDDAFDRSQLRYFRLSRRGDILNTVRSADVDFIACAAYKQITGTNTFIFDMCSLVEAARIGLGYISSTTELAIEPLRMHVA